MKEAYHDDMVNVYITADNLHILFKKAEERKKHLIKFNFL